MRASGALPRLSFAILVLALPPGCEAPPEARFPIFEQGAAMPTPELGETARFARVAEARAATGEELARERDALAARAAALRARAAALNAPVIDAESRDRLSGARATGIPQPGD